MAVLLVNRLRKLSERFIRPVVPVVVALALAIAATACTPGPAPTADIISGVVQGQDGPEGWTLYAAPGPQMKNVDNSRSADFHYYNWSVHIGRFHISRHARS